MYFFLHIFLMTAATLSLIVGISAAVFFRKKNNWLKIHKSFNSIALIVLCVGLLFIIIYIFEAGGKHLNGLHQLAGLAAFIFSGITMSVGFYQFKAKNKLAVRKTHRWLGRFSLLLLLTAITLGLKLINLF